MCNAIKNRNRLQTKKNKYSGLMILPLNFTPGGKDILCGRGNVFSNHDGNRYFGKIIRANLRSYRDAANRPEKIKVVDDILREIRMYGARFAKLDSETQRWYELSDVQAHQKIGHAIRDTIRLLKDKSKSVTKPKAKQSKITKRQRQASILKLKNALLPSTDTRKKTMDDILRMSIETSEFLNDVWGEAENMPPKPELSAEKVILGIKRENTEPILQFNTERRKSSRFTLKDEYPEQTFDFSAQTFFGDLNSFDAFPTAFPTRITSQ